MIKRVFSTSELPAYHSDLVVMQRRSTRGLAMATAAAPTAMSPVSAALQSLNRAGLIKRIISLAPRRRRVAEGALGVAAAPLEAFAPPAEEPHIIQLENPADVSALLSACASDPDIEFASRVPVRYLLARKRRVRYRGAKTLAAPPPATIAATPPPLAQLWNLRKIRWSEARANTAFRDATTVDVAVLDTGIDPDHPEFAVQTIQYDFDYPGVAEPSSRQDLIGHGTHVSGTICADINNRLGIAGVCACRLNAMKIFDDRADFISFAEGYVYFVNPIMYRQALAECVERRMAVVNLSIGGPGRPDQVESALFAQLIAGSTIVVAAMGNEREEGSPISFPAAIPGVIAVGATGLDDTVAQFSNRGGHITLTAPGVGIWSTLPTYPGQFGFRAVAGPDGRPREGKALRRETDYDAWDGTSMATPHVTAAAALLVANGRATNAATAAARFAQTVDRVPAMRRQTFSSDYGFGRLNLETALFS
jgi:subtilisin family serine protease